jgi:hypothetical protein
MRHSSWVIRRSSKTIHEPGTYQGCDNQRTGMVGNVQCGDEILSYKVDKKKTLSRLQVED